MKIVYTGEPAPAEFAKSLFLAGPTPRSEETPSWRPEALRLLEKAGYDGVVFVPEFRDGVAKPDLYNDENYQKQIEWEDRCLNMADCILFWVPRNMATMPALTTNIEWGSWCASGKAVFGAPEEAENVRYMQYYAGKLKVPSANSLKETVDLAVAAIGEGETRTDGEREVPAYIWKSPYFQQWYKTQKTAGNRLCGAKVEWTFRVGPKKNLVFLWALHVDVYIASECRHKTNEVIIGRPDISAVLMYKRGKDLFDTDIVLVREFRSPAANPDAFVWEIPSGSSNGSSKLNKNPFSVAADEAEEEIGLQISPCRIHWCGFRQIAATLSVHNAALFRMELTADEIDYLRSQKGIPHGIEADTERTYAEVEKLGTILEERKLDWSMVGMILSVLIGENPKN